MKNTKKLAMLLCAGALSGTLAGGSAGSVLAWAEEKHEHVYVDGVCECGRYEMSFITRIPMKNDLMKANEQTGTLEEVHYSTHAYAAEAASGESDLMVEKTMLVYLPYGYDPENQYNIVYLMHGGGESEYYWLADEPVKDGTMAMGKTTKAVLDNMLADGKIEPTIVVAPTFYTELEGYDTEQREFAPYFAQELRNEIIPAIESRYSTYAAGDVSEDNLINTRDHRAFAGFSMGSYTTIQAAMMQNLNLFAYYGSYSGSLTEVDDFVNAINAFGEDCDVKFWYNGNGTADMAHDEHEEFCQGVLEKMPERFQNGKNFAWIDFKGGSHAYNCWIVDLYNSMLVFFQK